MSRRIATAWILLSLRSVVPIVMFVSRSAESCQDKIWNCRAHVILNTSTIDRDALSFRLSQLPREAPPPSEIHKIIGSSASIRAVLNQIETVAPTDSTVLLLGETGTGKELFAWEIHQNSLRKDRAFVKVNCAAIPSGLIESELFGHEKGAFTSALTKRVGRFELADHGTLLLDEIGDIPLELQPKLLRVVQEGEFERLGSCSTLRVNVRLLAATHCDLPALVRQSAFRADLYYRLNVFPIFLPPLRQRIEDIPSLVRYFVSVYSRRMKKQIDVIPIKILDELMNYHWPGNIRELQNIVERAVILTPDRTLRLANDEVNNALAPAPQAPARIDTLKEAERDCILRALADANWIIGGRRGAAARLGLPRTTLIYKMRKLGIARQH
jgi:formate hydrogenlyase transcriptional activator